jgi:ferrous iron transport protein B
MPCVATIGVIYKEQGGFWAVFSVAWSLVIAYASAVVVYQLGSLAFADSAAAAPGAALAWSALVLALVAVTFVALVHFGRRREQRLIPLLSVD